MRPLFPSMAVVLALSLSLAPAPASVVAAQSSRDSVSGANVEAPASDAAQTSPSGLPRRMPVPRTMQAHWPVFALFAASWIGIVAYLLATERRAGRLTRRLREGEERR